MDMAYACGSGGVMFVPEKIEKTMPRMAIRRSNDNKTQETTKSDNDSHQKRLAVIGGCQYYSIVIKDKLKKMEL